MRSWKRIALLTAGGLVLLFALAQAIPYGRAHRNPPVQAEPKWDSPRTRELAVRACFDCHSNQTTWRWYSNVAPVSWLVQRDVDSGRSAVNFSEWNRPQDGAGDLVEAVTGKSMPPWFYVLLHSNAKLTAAERQALADGLRRTVQQSPPPGGAGG